MERDQSNRLAALAVAVRNAHHADKDFFTQYMQELRHNAW